jgi:hypothetical protein
VKRSGRDESIQVVIQMCMEAMLRISLLLSLSQASKIPMSFLLSLVFSSTKLEKRTEQVLPGSKEAWGGEGGGREQEGEMAQTMYAHMNKWINNKKQYLKKTNQNNSLTVKIMLRFLWMLGQVQGIKSEHL